MKDMVAHLEKLRVQISECELIRDLATDKTKRETFDNLAAHFKILAGELEKAIAKMPPDNLNGGSHTTFGDTFLGRKTYEPFPKSDDDG